MNHPCIPNIEKPLNAITDISDVVGSETVISPIIAEMINRTVANNETILSESQVLEMEKILRGLPTA